MASEFRSVSPSNKIEAAICLISSSTNSFGRKNILHPTENPGKFQICGLGEGVLGASAIVNLNTRVAPKAP